MSAQGPLVWSPCAGVSALKVQAPPLRFQDPALNIRCLLKQLDTPVARTRSTQATGHSGCPHKEHPYQSPWCRTPGTAVCIGPLTLHHPDHPHSVPRPQRPWFWAVAYPHWCFHATGLAIRTRLPSSKWTLQLSSQEPTSIWTLQTVHDLRALDSDIRTRSLSNWTTLQKSFPDTPEILPKFPTLQESSQLCNQSRG